MFLRGVIERPQSRILVYWKEEVPMLWKPRYHGEIELVAALAPGLDSSSQP